MLENNKTYKETILKYEVAKNTLKSWGKIYLEDGVKGLYEERRGLATKETSERKGRLMEIGKKVNGDLNAEMQRLRMENEYLEKLNALVQERDELQIETDFK